MTLFEKEKRQFFLHGSHNVIAPGFCVSRDVKNFTQVGLFAQHDRKLPTCFNKELLLKEVQSKHCGVRVSFSKSEFKGQNQPARLSHPKF